MLEASSKTILDLREKDTRQQKHILQLIYLVPGYSNVVYRDLLYEGFLGSGFYTNSVCVNAVPAATELYHLGTTMQVHGSVISDGRDGPSIHCTGLRVTGQMTYCPFRWKWMRMVVISVDQEAQHYGVTGRTAPNGDELFIQHPSAVVSRRPGLSQLYKKKQHRVLFDKAFHMGDQARHDSSFATTFTSHRGRAVKDAAGTVTEVSLPPPMTNFVIDEDIKFSVWTEYGQAGGDARFHRQGTIYVYFFVPDFADELTVHEAEQSFFVGNFILKYKG